MAKIIFDYEKKFDEKFKDLLLKRDKSDGRIIPTNH